MKRLIRFVRRTVMCLFALTPCLVVNLTFSSMVVLGQGTLNFANVGGGRVYAPVTNWDGTLLGTNFTADLWWAPGMVTDSNQLVELGQPEVFIGSGFFAGGHSRIIPGTLGGSIITVQVRVWNNALECGWDCDSPVFQHGASGLFQVTLTSPPDTPAELTGLLPFGLSPPTTRSAPSFSLNTLVDNRLVFTWLPSVVGTNFVLQQSTDLRTGNWITLTEAPTFVAPQFQIAITKPSSTMFYRLAR